MSIWVSSALDCNKQCFGVALLAVAALLPDPIFCKQPKNYHFRQILQFWWTIFLQIISMCKGWQGKKIELTKNSEVDGGSLRLFPVVIEDLVVCFTSDRFPILKTRGHEGDAWLGLICIVVLWQIREKDIVDCRNRPAEKIIMRFIQNQN